MENIMFASELLKKLGVNSHIVDETDFHQIDLGLRSLIFEKEIYTTFLSHTLDEIKDKKIYRYMDEYRCCYIAMKLCEKNKFFFIGPYLTKFPDENFIRSKIPSSESSDEIVQMIEKYYTNLPLTDEDNHLIAIATILGKSLWGDENNFTFEYMDEIFFDQVDPSNIPKKYGTLSNSAFHLKLLETNQEYENELINAVSSGRPNDINFNFSSLFNNSFHHNPPDPLRSRKNQLIRLNTLLRKGAEQGGVHPLHIDKLYSQFEEKTEEIYSVQESLMLQRKMINEYCFLVKKHSLSKHSPLIGKTITLIDYDISADLTLKSISEQLFVNPSYLSSVFSNEMGITLTEYVHLQKMKKAVMLLHKTNMQIQDIATESGFSDVNYFIKLFKKHYGITPTIYRKNIGKNIN